VKGFPPPNHPHLQLRHLTCTVTRFLDCDPVKRGKSPEIRIRIESHKSETVRPHNIETAIRVKSIFLDGRDDNVRRRRKLRTRNGQIRLEGNTLVELIVLLAGGARIGVSR
jgi:hypothetical protein